MKIFKVLLLILSSMAAVAAAVYAFLEKREECLEYLGLAVEKVKDIGESVLGAASGLLDRVFTEEDLIESDEAEEAAIFEE